jgi:hypothetical protein
MSETGEPMNTTSQALERAALDGHRLGQSWQAYFAANAGAISAAIRTNPVGWGRLGERLLHLLTTGDPSGRRAAGDREQGHPSGSKTL